MHDRSSEAFELAELLHPAGAFERPVDVLSDADLTLNEKRAILAAWASDACAVDAAPALRTAPRGAVVQFDEIMDALRALDRQADLTDDSHHLSHHAVRPRGWCSSDPSGRSGHGPVLHR
jgi:hypothetical protein